MGTTQKYSLKWNDFTVNVASTFRDLHSRHDFVDVTLACADGSTLEAHKVILSSVSTYFRDILKQTPCKHPIIILKDTGRDEASAMLEFAYTGEVNVAQDLLPSLLHTARCFKIKGLDKVESPVEQPMVCPRVEAQTPSSEHWVESAPPTRSHTPSSVHSQHEIKSHTDHFVLSDKSNSSPPTTENSNLGNLLRSVEHERERQLMHSPPPSLPGSQPHTREASPCPNFSSGNFNARTPPPKRWKRSFDMTQPTKDTTTSVEQPLPLISENSISSHARDDYECLKRFRDPATLINPRSMPYPHSMPTSPTMFERGNETRLAGLFRHHLANGGGNNGVVSTSMDDGRCSPSPKTSTPQQQATSTTSDSTALDYRCYPNQPKIEPHSECDYPQSNGRHLGMENGSERYKVNSSMAFRPESAPTVLDMSPDGSLSGPPSVRTSDLSDMHRDDDDLHGHHGDDFSDCMSKAFSIRPDGMGQYTCDECGKIFKHPGSLQHHRHIHRGTHRCPSCGKAFSRRWDMERHLNKSKYGCPANRFSGGGTDSTQGSPCPSPSPMSGGAAVMTATTHLEILAAVSNSPMTSLHNSTA